MKIRSRNIAVAAVAVMARTAFGQEHSHTATSLPRLGTVHFATSCAPSTAPTFDRGVALLHSFEFAESIRTFNEVLAGDSTCAMARWGIALSRWGNPMAPGERGAVTLEPGRVAAIAAVRSAESAGTTDREREYAAAVSVLYADYEHTPQGARVVAYEKAMRLLVAAQPADTEAKIFHAIALVAAASPTDKTYASQLEAGATLEALWAKQPSHPGLAHYIIHAYDSPALASRAESAATRYADIAPSAAHALHMPSHTFTRTGQWQASIATNLKSIAAARAAGAIAEALHASDYAMYAYLQLHRDSAAHALLLGLPKLAKGFDANAISGAAPGAAGVFALAAIPARYALERRAWSEAAALRPASTPFPYADAMTYLAVSLGASHTGKMTLARASADSLLAIRERLKARNDAYWSEQVAIEELEARAWIDFAAGRKTEALSGMLEAATREDATEKSVVTPGPLAPAHELFGDMMMDLRKPAAALAQYRATLSKEPNRYRALYGAMVAAQAAGDRGTASMYAVELNKLTAQRAPR
ncbi:MAG: hypothetical protein ABI442_19635 [Gemmatimonadaceae bacterium]